MSDQLDITQLTAEDVAKLYPADEESDVPNDPGCVAMDQHSAYSFWCTRPGNHPGPHVAYGADEERPYAIWNDGEPTRLLFNE